MITEKQTWEQVLAAAKRGADYESAYDNAQAELYRIGHQQVAKACGFVAAGDPDKLYDELIKPLAQKAAFEAGF